MLVRALKISRTSGEIRRKLGAKSRERKRSKEESMRSPSANTGSEENEEDTRRNNQVKTEIRRNKEEVEAKEEGKLRKHNKEERWLHEKEISRFPRGSTDFKE